MATLVVMTTVPETIQMIFPLKLSRKISSDFIFSIHMVVVMKLVEMVKIQDGHHAHTR